MEIYYFIGTLLLGLLLGSFNNVVIYRLPLNQNIAYPSSHCPKCEHALAWYDNIPLFSYLFLRGRCRYCKETISSRYPFVEAMTMVLFGLAYFRFGLSFELLFALIFIDIGIIIFYIDRDHQIIPNILTIILFVLGLLKLLYWVIFENPRDFGYFFFGLVIGFLILYFIRVFGEIVYKKEALGLGDVKLLAVGGLFLGWPNVFLTLLIASVFGSVIELTLIRLNRKSREDRIAFGPYLLLGLGISLFWGEMILTWYLNLF